MANNTKKNAPPPYPPTPCPPTPPNPHLHDLLLDKLGEALLDAAHGLRAAKGLHAERQVERDVAPRTLVAAHCAAHKVAQRALEKVLHQVPVGRARQRVLERVKQHARQLLHVVLLERVRARPPKAHRERLCGHAPGAAQLQVRKQQLQLAWDRCRVLVAGGARGAVLLAPHVQHAAELGRHVERLCREEGKGR